MPRSSWSHALLALVSLSLVPAAGCLGQRRPQSRDDAPRQGSGKVPAHLIQPGEVDGRFDDQIEGERVRVVYDEDDPARGAALPLVTIVEYSDFQCPYCSKLAQALDEAAADYPGEVKLVFKQYPLAMHPQAEPAARAALAAHAQGKFWEMHDLLFANQGALSDVQLARYAEQLGLDMKKWREDFGSEATAKHVAEEIAGGEAFGIRSTPTFYVNGKFFKGAQPADQVRGIIDGELLHARALLKAGVKREELYARILHAAPSPEGEGDGDGGQAAAEPADKAPDAAVPTRGALDPDDEGYGEPHPPTNYAVPIGEGRPIKGPADALVTIVEFGAFDCDACRAVQPVLQQLMAKYPRDVRLVFRHLPETNAARRGAQIAMAAHRQGKFWEAHDALLKADEVLSLDVAETMAKEIGLDLEAFNKDIRDRGESGAVREIQKDMAVVDAFRGKGKAPLLFVNGRYVDGSKANLATLEALVQEEKRKAEAFLAANQGLRRRQVYDAMRKTWRGYELGENPPPSKMLGGQPVVEG